VLTLETRRLRLEPLAPRHAAALFEELRDSRLYEFLSEEPPASVAALRARYRMLARRKSPDGTEGWLNWALWSRDACRYVGYVQATVRPDRSAGIAYLLFAPYWGSGYAREAVAAMVTHLREHHDVTLISARVDTKNSRSIVLLEALGFERIAVYHAAACIRGIPRDDSEYRLIAR
jgi:ribosomal-protein-alanine N-acetyltransferase